MILTSVLQAMGLFAATNTAHELTVWGRAIPIGPGYFASLHGLIVLGLLPLVENDHNYFFFESRSYPGDGKSKSIGQLAAHWAGKLIGSDEPAFPFVALSREYSDFGQRIAEQLRAETFCNRIVAISFGVGGNQNKRVSDHFEERLIRYLLTNSKVILDKGTSAEERDQINRIVAGVRALGKTVVEFNEENKAAISDQTNRNWLQADVVTWDGSIGAFAGLIAASDQYIGYDSAGQHIAAALGAATGASSSARWTSADARARTADADQSQSLAGGPPWGANDRRERSSILPPSIRPSTSS